ncbi:MAG: STAS domain-containing protein [Aquihabitans sp.]
MALDDYLWIEVEADGTSSTVAVRGELDAGSAPHLGEAIAQAASTGAPIHLDLNEVGFIDSSGLRVVAEAVRLAKEDGRALQVTAMSDAVRRVFEVSGLVRQLPS